MKPPTGVRCHVLVHDPPAGVGCAGLAGAEDGREEAVARAEGVGCEIRAGLLTDEDPSFVVVVDAQLTGETVFSSEDEPQARAAAGA